MICQILSNLDYPRVKIARAARRLGQANLTKGNALDSLRNYQTTDLHAEEHAIWLMSVILRIDVA
jgi:hypothetical protein